MSKRIKWTIEKVKEKCEEHGVVCLEKEYVNNATKMRFKCKCGNEYVACWSDVTRRNQWQCLECGIKNRAEKQKLNFDEIKRICKKHEIECLEEEYVDSKTKMKFKCKCGNEYEAKWSTVTGYSQWQCPKCSGKAKWTIEMVKEECRDNRIECLEEEYVNAHTKMRFKCGCGNIYEAKWNTVTSRGQWKCPECSGITKWTIEEIKRICEEEHGIECLEEEYVNNATKMRFKCDCGNEFERSWNAVTRQKHWKCPECSGMTKWAIEEIKRICEEEHGIECLEEEYANSRTKMRFKCGCGNVYEAQWGNVIGGNEQWQCPECSKKTSKGEIITREFLSNLLKDENSFEEQKTFKDLVDEKILSYDFFIPEFNILIEIQGGQHYKPIEMFGGKESFKIQQYHDKLKREYAKQNGFTLIEIPWKCNGINTEKKLIEELKNKLSGLIK